MFDEELLTRLPEGMAETVTGWDGSDIFCLSSGGGPTAVLAHGYLADLTIFNLVFRDLLEAGYRVISFDHPTFDESRARSQGGLFLWTKSAFHLQTLPG